VPKLTENWETEANRRNQVVHCVLLLLAKTGLDQLERLVPRIERREKWDSRSFVPR
jgi:hypothetical protein